MSRFGEYYRLTKPGIIRGNLVHALAGVLLASAYGLQWGPALGLLIGICLVIAAACIVNNYTDRAIDARMARTKKRASVTGSVPVRNAMALAAVLLLAGFTILIVYTNPLVSVIGVVAFVFYTVIYAVAKRHTVHSTLVGAIPGALPPLAGYVAISGVIDFAAILLFVLVLVWQMPHFYAISIFRRKEYEAASVPVMSVKYGFSVVRLQIIMYTVLYLCVVVGLIAAKATSEIGGVVLLLGAMIWLITVLRPVEDEVRWAKKVFGVSLTLTLLLLLAGGFNAIITLSAVQSV
jgi:protoheme IX farnesyltransferase